MPIPNSLSGSNHVNRLVALELDYDKEAHCIEYNRLKSSMIDEQNNIFNTIMNSILTNQVGIFFINSHGGIGKTFLWRTLTFTLRFKGNIVLIVASSQIASLLLSNGRIAHSRFHTPINLIKDCTCNIQ